MSNLSKYITLLEKLTNKKVRLIEEENSDNNILIPRRSPEERQKNYIIAINKKIQEYIKNGNEGDLDLSNTPIETLPDNLIEVNGRLNLANCKNLKSLNNLKYVEGDLDLSECKNLISLNNLKYVNGYLDLSYCINLIELPDSLSVGGSLYLSNTSIKKLPDSLTNLYGDLDLTNCKNLKDLNNLRYVEGCLYLSNTLIERLPDDLIIRGIIYLVNTPLVKNEKLLNQYRKKLDIIV
jgi:hypothetical protein